MFSVPFIPKFDATNVGIGTLEQVPLTWNRTGPRPHPATHSVRSRVRGRVDAGRFRLN
jgi:hypothetical protein